MQNKQFDLDAVLKEVCIRYVFSIIIVSSFFAIYYLYEKIEPLNYFVSLCPIGHLLWLIIPCKLDYESIRRLIPAYIVYISLFLYGNILFFWHFGQITAFMWYTIIPIAAMLFFDRKTVARWGLYVLGLICSVFVVELLIPEGLLLCPTSSQLATINIMTIILSIGFILFFLYYFNKITFIKETQAYNLHLDTKEDAEEEKESETLENLYIDILKYFSEKRPYCNPDFSIMQLAKDLNSNVKYVSKIIKMKENVNFSIFINSHRVNLVKELIEKDYHNKYTIRYIYVTAGFRHQSTFNKVFKEIEGITPSEYIKNNKIKKKK